MSEQSNPTKDGIAYFPAPYIVHTVQGPVFCCGDHMRKLVALQTFLGVHAHVETIADYGRCSNCEHEANRS
ncbi:MAG: hypothetical protein ACREUG_02485 [Steroidobacteraceae bacterium]